MTWPIAAVVMTLIASAHVLVIAFWRNKHALQMRVTDGEAAKLADQHDQLVSKLKALEEKLTLVNNRTQR